MGNGHVEDIEGAVNQFDNLAIDTGSWSYLDIIGKSRWETWTPVFGSLTVVGTPTYVGRFMVMGAMTFFQVKVTPGTSIASVAGTDYLNLPTTARAVGGMASMTNDTTNIAVGLCHIDVATGRCYLPTQLASGNVFTVSGWYES